METDVAELLFNNNIHLVLSESGAGHLAGKRLAALSGADYFHADVWKMTAFFRPIHDRITELTNNAVATNRRAVSDD